VTLKILLTFEPPKPIDAVRLHMSPIMWASVCHGKCRRLYLTFWAAISH